ncbi:MAG: hypothetical protein JO266_08300 [Acidobacteria bacterium]|nr:hypothetical protein [Acidobacteriota bacterium]
MDASELTGLIQERIDRDVDTLFAGLFSTLDEDHALPQDPVEAGRRAFFAIFERLRNKVCDSATVSQIRQDFNRSGPVVAMLIATDSYLNQHQIESCAYLGALIIKLGVDRLCDGAA